MNQEIRNRFTGAIIIEAGKYASIKEAVEEKRANLWEADLREANLWGADLREADLRGADLRGANLWGADLWGANLWEANLWGANLRGANLRGADLRGANLRRADLWEANLRKANLRGANLRGANLRRANLWEADLWEAKNVIFNTFPPLSFFCHFPLGTLPNEITLELMRRDAWAHPDPKKFDIWVKGGECPYALSDDRMFFFQEKKELWRRGKPQMKDSDLVIAICKEKGWKIKGYID